MIVELEERIQIAVSRNAQQIPVERAIRSLRSVVPHEENTVIVGHGQQICRLTSLSANPVERLGQRITHQLAESRRGSQPLAHALMSGKVLRMQLRFSRVD